MLTGFLDWWKKLGEDLTVATKPAPLYPELEEKDTVAFRKDSNKIGVVVSKFKTTHAAIRYVVESNHDLYICDATEIRKILVK